MTSLWAALALGFWLGMKHATDSDHVVAVSTIVARAKKLGTSWLLGAFWGLGHTVTIFAVGAAIIVLKVEVPARVGLSMEFAVSLVLILLGAVNMAGYGLGSLGLPKHAHPHSHDDPEHAHALLEHSHGAHGKAHAHLVDVDLGWLKGYVKDAGVFQLARSLAVGLVHGLAGSAAAALLVLATIREPRAAVCYLLIFGVGTMAGMLLLSALMEFAMFKLARSWDKSERLLTLATGVISFSFGLWMAYRLGFVDGLFSSAPRWTPQ